uniref:Uncharacterized protein n=1 Tax=Glossina brevipalpis TaxID=37001 RepID=A0A1A9WB95_9MUSC
MLAAVVTVSSAGLLYIWYQNVLWLYEKGGGRDYRLRVQHYEAILICACSHSLRTQINAITDFICHQT